MLTGQLEVGCYGVTTPANSSEFEDESVGNEMIPTQGIVVSRVASGVVFVRDWSISSHFDGADALEKFAEARQHYDFAYTFSAERSLAPGDELTGSDPALKLQLKKQLASRH